MLILVHLDDPVQVGQEQRGRFSSRTRDDVIDGKVSAGELPFLPFLKGWQNIHGYNDVRIHQLDIAPDAIFEENTYLL